MKDALQLIIGRSSAAMSDALDCLKAVRVKSPMVARRYEHVAGLALNDTSANWTPAERALIASYLATDDEGGTKPRNIRLSDEDWQRAAQIGDGNATAGIRRALNEYSA
jgi:hypothetical protein